MEILNETTNLLKVTNKNVLFKSCIGYITRASIDWEFTKLNKRTQMNIPCHFLSVREQGWIILLGTSRLTLRDGGAVWEF